MLSVVAPMVGWTCEMRYLYCRPSALALPGRSDRTAAMVRKTAIATGRLLLERFPINMVSSLVRGECSLGVTVLACGPLGLSTQYSLIGSGAYAALPLTRPNMRQRGRPRATTPPHPD